MPAAVRSVNERLDHLGSVAGGCQEIGPGRAGGRSQIRPLGNPVSVGKATTAMILHGLGWSHRQWSVVPHSCAKKPGAHL